MMVEKQLSKWVDAILDHNTNNTLTYFSRVSVEHRCVCVTVPKIASSRILMTLHMLNGNPELHEPGAASKVGLRLSSFERDQILEMLTSPEWFRFCFVRNPYDRLLSAYKTQVGNTWNKEYQWLKDDIRMSLAYSPDEDGLERLVPFRDFVRYLHDAGDRVRRDGHFNVQARILVPDLIAYDFIGRFETFQSDFEHVLTRLNAPPDILATASVVKNPTTQVYPPAIVYDREQADLVYDIYEADFETFGYDRDYWMYELEKQKHRPL